MKLSALFAILLVTGAATVLPGVRPVAGISRDLQGVWDMSTLTLLQRPPEFKDKAFFTAAEAAEYERTARERALAQLQNPAEVKLNADLDDTWAEAGVRVQPTRRTSLIVDPPDGRVPPLTPEGQARRRDADEAKKAPPDGPEALPLSERCLKWGAGPPLRPGPYNNNVQIVQTAKYVVISTEMIHEARIVPLDGRPHLAQTLQQWTGDSRGHWERDTLVIETTNFTPKTPFDQLMDSRHPVERTLPARSSRRVVERLTRVSATALLYQFIVDDPAVFTRPWSGELTMRRTTNRVYEYACHEGNYSMAGTLRGARASEEAKQP